MITPRRPHPRRRGAAMLWALLSVFTVAAACGVLLSSALSTNRDAQVERRSTEASFLAEGALEAADRELRQAVANFAPVPTEGEVTIAGQTVEYDITPTGYAEIVTDPAGIQTIRTGYRIDARAQAGFAVEQAHAIVNVEATPIFQFAVFYTGDLEINPGPSMTLGGRVHTNSDMYVNCGGTLTVDTNYMRAVGDVYRNRKDDPTKSQGTILVRKWVQDPNDAAEPEEYETMHSASQMDGFGISTTSGYDSAFAGHDANGDGDYEDAGEWLPWGPGALETWAEPDGYLLGAGNTVLTKDHGVSEATVPSVGSIAMYDDVETGGDHVWDAVNEVYQPVTPGSGTHVKGYYHSQAGLSLQLHTDGSWSAWDADGYDVTALVDDAVSVITMYDARQANGSGGDVEVLEVDLDLLGQSGQFPDNGLLYAGTLLPGTGTDSGGLVLKEGAELAGPLSVVSETSLYVQGDYNVTNKVGASVVADAVNLLSNSWTGTKGPGQLPTASETTFNVAMITGNHDTVGSAYNGGLENLPRFHEEWSNVDCNIVGSFVNTWSSQYATGKWKYGGDSYKAPKRKWSYDTDFNDISNLPPFTPMAVTTRPVAFWDRLQP